MTKLELNKIYQHYKGPLYRTLYIAKSTETLEEFVVYECLYPNPEGQIWARPYAMFTGTLDVDGKTVPRFVLTDKK